MSWSFGSSIDWADRCMVDLVNDLMARKVGLKSLNDPIDTTTSHGRLTFNLFASLAEFERDVIRERTQAGLSAPRVRGRCGDRPRGITSKAESTAYAAEGLVPGRQVERPGHCRELRIAKSTLYAYLRHRGVKIGPYRRPREADTEFIAREQPGRRGAGRQGNKRRVGAARSRRRGHGPARLDGQALRATVAGSAMREGKDG